MQFIRYGSLVPQFHDTKKDSFHVAPVEWGFYAFPRGFEERFLLGGVGSGNIRNGRYRYLRDEHGRKIFASVNEFYGKKKGWVSGEDVLDFDSVSEPFMTLLKKQKLTVYEVSPYQEDENGICRDCLPENYDMKVPFYVENKPRRFEYSGEIWSHFGEFGFRIKPSEIITRAHSWIKTDIRTYKKLLDRAIAHEKYRGNLRQPGPSSGYPVSRIDKDWFEVFIEKI